MILDWLRQRLWARVLLSYMVWSLFICIVSQSLRIYFSFIKSIVLWHSVLALQAAVTECHRLMAYKQQNFFLAGLEAGKSQIKMTADLTPGEDRFLIHRWLASLCVLPWQRERESSWGLFYKAINPHDLTTSQRPYLLTPSYRALGFNIGVLEEHRHSVYGTKT